jgi:lysophospholipase L1-like esterase
VRHTALSYRRVLIALAGVFALHACSDLPTTPTPPPPVPDPPKLTCPAPMTLLSPQATPISVVYGTPTVANGAPPLTVVCTPASGTIFPTGPNTVTCTATDNQQRTDSCAFAITVNVPPKISATRYVAFGDSMTAGEVVSAGSGFSRILRLVPEQAYPAVLQKDLTNLYSTQGQSISVRNEGKQGETAVDGYARLPGVLSQGNYQVLTLMDGANDLASRDSVKAQQGLQAIWKMVQEAKSRGLKVFLATLPPQNKNSGPPRYGLAEDEVPAFNDGVRYIAEREAITLVDVYEAFHGDNTTLIDVDGLHPTPAGYQAIADAFFKAIRQDLQESSPSSFRPNPFQLRMLVRPRR